MRFHRLMYIFNIMLVSWPFVLSGAVIANSNPPLKVGYVDSMGYPLVGHLEKDGKKNDNGILVDLSDAIAAQLKTKALQSAWPRKRVEQAAIDGVIDMYCFARPAWTEKPKAFEWSIPLLKQVEYIVVRKGVKMPEKIPNDLLGMHIVTMLGYHYLPIQKLFDEGQAFRLDKLSPNDQFFEVAYGADMLITSKDEIEGYFFRNPEKRNLYQVSKRPFTTFATSCAISPKSSYSKAQIDKAIKGLKNSKKLDQLLLKYKLN